MPDKVETEGSPNMAALVGGIITDAQQLIRQEITLARSELHQEWAKIKTAAVAMAAGGLIALVGGFLLAFGLVHLLHSATGAADPATVPLWGCFLLVGGVFCFLGGTFLFRGISKAGEIQVPPQTVDSLKEII